MIRFCFVLTIVLLWCQTLTAQNPAEIHARIRAALENRDYTAVSGELQNLQRTEPRLFALNNYDYLLARVAERRGDAATATVNYQTVVARNSVLREYALWHLAQIARQSRNLLLERIYLQQLQTLEPNGLLREPADLRLANSFFESGDFQGTVESLRFRVSNVKPTTNDKQSANNEQFKNPKQREKFVLLAQALRRGGKPEEARRMFVQLLTDLPNPATPDDFALTAARELDELDGGAENFGKRSPTLADPEHLRRALIYQFNRDFANARLHYSAIVTRFPASPNAPDALYQLGRISNVEGKFDEAVKQFDAVIAKFPERNQARDALTAKASALSRLKRHDEAIAAYTSFIRQYVDTDEAENPERPFLNIIDILRDAGRDDEALRWAAQTRQRFQGGLGATLALFTQARIRLSQANWQAALTDLTELENASNFGERAAGGTNETEIQFLRAFCLEQLGRYAEAVDAYLEIPDGRNEYYGAYATARLRKLDSNARSNAVHTNKLNQLLGETESPVTAANAERLRQSAQSALRLYYYPEVRRKMLEVISRAYSFLPAYNRIPSGSVQNFGRQNLCTDKLSIAPSQNARQHIADELLFLGLYDEGTPELEAAGKTSSAIINNPNAAFTFAVYYKRGDSAHRAVGYAEPLWRNVPADYQIELIPQEWRELLYPAPYSDELLKFAAPRLDPLFVLSIMRQESRYRADVKSVAAARGLMQFIPDTSLQIAAQLKQPNFRQDDLYNPPTAILFGSQYLGNLFEEFVDQPQAVAASYNGGEINMRRWLARARSNDPDRYVAEIQFVQSKDYVYKVLANHRVYQTFYDRQLKLQQN